MINVLGRAAISRALDPLGRRLARAGVSPDAITIAGTVIAVAASLIFFTNGWWFSGALIIWGAVMLDVVDGAVARAGGTSSKFGAVLDSTCDRIVDAAVFGSIGWYYAMHDDPPMLLACLLCLVLGQLTSYIRARAEGLGMNATVGIAERAERLIIVLVGTGLSGQNIEIPYVQAVALWVLVGASTITVVQRMVVVHRQSRAAQEADRTRPDPAAPSL